MDTIALEPGFVEALRLSPDAARRLHGTLPGERHDWVPPWAAADLARQAGAACWRALGSALACIYAAAHLADDLADRDATPSQWTEGTLTVVELLTAGRQGVAQLDLDPAGALAVHASLDEAVRQLIRGQRRDVAGRERPPLDPVATAELKAGASVAAFFEVAALVAKADARAWARTGEAMGVLGQAVSDLRDWLPGGRGEDFAQGLPGTALALALDSSAGPAIRLALAGPRAHTRAAAVAALADAGDFWSAVDALLDRLVATVEGCIGDEVVLRPLLEVAHAWVQQVHARRPRRPVLLGRLARWDRLEPRARAFLDADPSYREAVPVHRWSMDGRTEVSAGSFGPLVVMEARQSCGDTVTEDILDKLCARAEAWGWRYFDAFPRIPVDIDTSGVALQVLAAAQRQDSTAAREARDAILAEPTPDGLLTTWRHHPRTEQPWRWERARCPVATANALAGLAAVNTWSPRMELAADALLAWAIDPDPSESAHYAQDVARGWVLLQLHRIGRGKAATPLAHELLAAFDLRGRVGSVLATAAAVRGLRAVGLGDRLPPAALVGLGEALSADGGVRADPFFRTIRPGQGQEPGRGAAWVSSRIVGTAWVRAALVGTASLHRGCRRVVGFFGA